MANRLATVRELYAVFADAITMSTPATATFSATMPAGQSVAIGDALLVSGTDFNGTADDFAIAVNNPEGPAYDLAYAVLEGSVVKLYPLTSDVLTLSSTHASVVISARLLPVKEIVAMM